MDKYEYKIKLDQMKSLVAEHKYEAAAELADTINWHKIKNVNALMKAGEIYEKVERYEESRDILLMAYDRSPIGRMIIYRLAEVAIKMGNYSEAKEYYDEFVEIAPHDNLKYVLRYEISKAQGADVNTLIAILEELKEQEYLEEWAFELACLYHRAGMSEKCIEACDELILWFGDGPYVEHALELKMLYQPLTRQQEEKYRGFRQKKEGMIEVTPDEPLESGEIISETVQIPKVKLNPERFNTQNLQEELQKSMQQIMEATEKETVDDSMDNIKKLVEDIPYLQIPKDEEVIRQQTAEMPHIETDAEIDDSLKTNFREFLAEDRDGQMSLYVPEHGHMESQITGQLCIDEVLAEWEKTKRAAEAALLEAEQRKLESAKARALQEAGDIMERLADVIPKLDSGLTPKDLLDEQYLGGKPIAEDRAAEMVANMNQLLQQEIDRLSNENAQIDEQLAAAGLVSESVAPAVRTMAGGYGSGVGDIENIDNIGNTGAGAESAFAEPEQEILPEIDVRSVLWDEPEQTAPGAGEFAGATEPELEDFATVDTADLETVGSATGEMADFQAADLETAGTARERFRVVQPEMTEPEFAETVEPEMTEPEQAVYEEESAQERTAEEIEAELLAQMARDIQTEVQTASGKRQSTQRVRQPQVAVPEVSVSEEDDGHVIRKLSKEQRELFTYFVPISGMEKQLCQALTGASARLGSGKSAATGNMIIQGGKGSGKTVLATSVVKALQKECGKPDGRIGKIEASTLNQKNPAVLLGKVAGGCLIIERAGGISKSTAHQLGALLARDTSGVLVIIEDTPKGIRKALSRDAEFAARFSEKINIPIFTSDELVMFAKSYANELGYTIDEMGVLALYNCISNIQKLDEATTLTEVKEIVDKAIARAERGGLKKAFSIITSQRYDEDDYIILREKNFEF